jgi:hypothetical protein
MDTAATALSFMLPSDLKDLERKDFINDSRPSLLDWATNPNFCHI